MFVLVSKMFKIIYNSKTLFISKFKLDFEYQIFNCGLRLLDCICIYSISNVY